MSTIAVLFYIIGLSSVKKIEPVTATSSQTLECNIENVSYLNKSVSISGFAINKGSLQNVHNWILGDFKSVYNNNSIVLVDEDNNCYELKTQSFARPDVTKSVNDGIDYRNCGITAKVMYSSLSKGRVYRVAVISEDQSGKKEMVFSDKEVRI